MFNTSAITGVFTSRYKWLKFSAVFALFVLTQLPFLHADADINLSRSRAPWTDEGLYTAQVRNGSIVGHISMDESDALVKEPGFAALAWIATQVGGDSMVVTRFVLIVVNGLLIAWLVSDAMIGMAVVVVLLPALFFAYYPFHYAHLAMAEMPAISMLFLALLFLSRRLSGQGSANIVRAAFAIFLAYAIKFQFIYMAAWPSLAIAVAALFRVRPLAEAVRDFVAASAIGLAFCLLYWAGWLLPNWGLISFIMRRQVGERMSDWSDMLHTVYAQCRVLLFDVYLWPLMLVSVMSIALAIHVWRADRSDDARKLWTACMCPAIAWLMLEGHKLVMVYMPSRYLLSLYAAMAAVAGGGFLLLRQRHLHLPVRYVVGLGVAIAIAWATSIGFYIAALERREYQLERAQTFLRSEGNWRGRTVVGAWAPSLFWGTEAVTIPIWKDYFNATRILARFRPVAIVAESDEADSGQALRADGVDAARLASRIHRLRVARWDLVIYEVEVP